MYGTVDEVYSHGDELKAMGLNVPEITDIFLKLKAQGVNCRTNIYTVEQGVAEIKDLREVLIYDFRYHNRSVFSGKFYCAQA